MGMKHLGKQTIKARSTGKINSFNKTIVSYQRKIFAIFYLFWKDHNGNPGYYLFVPGLLQIF